jgi:preprotein translocase subunit YajC
MFDVTHLLIAAAWAQDATSTAPSGGGSSSTSMLMNFAPLLLIFAVFYVLIIRPQQKKMDEQAKMIKALRRGDRVITTGGIHGKIAKLDGDDNLIVEIADGVQIKILRTAVQGLAAKTDPTVANDGEDAEKKSGS